MQSASDMLQILPKLRKMNLLVSPPTKFQSALILFFRKQRRSKNEVPCARLLEADVFIIVAIPSMTSYFLTADNIPLLQNQYLHYRSHSSTTEAIPLLQKQFLLYWSDSYTSNSCNTEAFPLQSSDAIV
jgi:hypothetical protein